MYTSRGISKCDVPFLQLSLAYYEQRLWYMRGTSNLVLVNIGIVIFPRFPRLV